MKVMIGLLTTLALSMGALSAENESPPAPSAGINAGYLPIGIGVLSLTTLVAIVLAVNSSGSEGSRHSHN